MLPRQVLPRQFYLITRRCAQRQLLLRPDPATNNAFLYCLIHAALRCEIGVLLLCAMSNHYHAVIYDRVGRYPEFIEHFHRHLARSQNALRGRWEAFWSCEQTCVVKLVDREAVIDKLVYTATNPVQDHLVDLVHHWPGVNGLGALLTGRPLRATRPLHFFRPDGPMPEAVELPLTVPLSSDPPPRCSRSCATAYAPSSSSTRPSEGAPGVACWVDARCWRSRGAITRRLASLGGTSGPTSRGEASGRGSRRCCAIARSSGSTPAPASDGETAFPPCSHPAPTGSSGSRRSRCSRHDRVRSLLIA